jgi:hypothetical protein
MRLVSGRNLQARRFDLDEALVFKPSPKRRLDAPTQKQPRPPVGVP